MKARRPRALWFDLGLGGVLLAGGAVLGAALDGTLAAVGGALAGLAAAALLTVAFRRGDARRRAALAAPFPAAWRKALLHRYDHYHRLPDEWRARFEDDIRLFLADKRITGVEVEASDELRLLVAASAVTLSLGWPAYEWDQLSEVLLYPQDFDRDYGYENAELAGQTHAWGTVILSVPALLESFEDPDDGYHVGIHEFAHLLEVDHTRFSGIPVGLDPRRRAEWVALADKEVERLRRGKSILDPYAAEQPAERLHEEHPHQHPEFLAVAVESFFEAPLALRQRHLEVYELLSEYFAQDPAAWDDARGL